MPNEKVKQDNQERVLNKALELCAEKGLEQMTMADLAKESNVSLRSVFRYYNCKEELIKKIVESAVNDLANTLVTVINEDSYKKTDGAHKVIALCRTMLTYAKTNSKLQSKLLAAEPYLSKVGIPDAYSLFDSKGNAVTQIFLGAFKDGIKDGSIDPQMFENKRNFTILAVVYRGFYTRIAMICLDEKNRNKYDLNQLMEDYLAQVYQSISSK